MVDQLDLFFSCRAKDCGMTWTTNRCKAAVRGLVRQPITAYVGHLRWQRSVATLTAASGSAICAYTYGNAVTNSQMCLIL